MQTFALTESVRCFYFRSRWRWWTRKPEWRLGKEPGNDAGWEHDFRYGTRSTTRVLKVESVFFKHICLCYREQECKKKKKKKESLPATCQQRWLFQRHRHGESLSQALPCLFSQRHNELWCQLSVGCFQSQTRLIQSHYWCIFLFFYFPGEARGVLVKVWRVTMEWLTTRKKKQLEIHEVTSQSGLKHNSAEDFSLSHYSVVL